VLYAELQAACEQGVVLSDELQFCYLMTPLSKLPYIGDWMVYLNFYDKLSPVRKKLADAAGIKPYFIQKKAMGQTTTLGAVNNGLSEDQRCRRFWLAMALCELIREEPVHIVAEKYKIDCGTLQSMMTSASSFGMMVVHFSRRIGWWHLDVLMHEFVRRLDTGVKPDLLPLVEAQG